MIHFQHAQQIIADAASLLRDEELPMAMSLGRILAQEVTSRETIPPFDNSAMDGFAVRAVDVAKATEQAPISLRVVGTTAAGDCPAIPQDTQQKAWRIMTGAAVPQGFDAIYPIETVTVNGDEITINHALPSSMHIRRKGEDFSAGEVFAHKGERITPGMIAALASAGIARVRVIAKPKVLHFATGSELVENADQALTPGQIRNSNSPFLQAALQSLEVESVYGGQVRDEPEVFMAQLRAAMNAQQPDIILTTGAVSAGDFDFIPRVIADLGGQILFHKVMIKPGKPVLFARLPNGSFFFGLPGNPVSTAVGLRFFVYPLLRRLQGLGEEQFVRALFRGKASKPKADWRFFIKAKTALDDTGQLIVEINGGQESHKIKPLVSSNAWLILEEGKTEFVEGDRVLCCPLIQSC